MIRNIRLALMVSLLFIVAACNTVAPDSPPLAEAPEGTVIPGRYLVVMAEPELQTLSEEGFELAVTSLSQELQVQAEQPLRVINGFVADLSQKELGRLENDPRIAYLEEDRVVSLSATQTGAPWGLDRIDQRNRPLNSTYSYSMTGAGVSVYILDTGIRSSHQDFGGRASGGFSSINDGNGTDDCNGHGTHVAGTVGGTTYGVAKGAKLIAVRVMGCTGSGTLSGVIAGIDWLTKNHVKPAVANMSLGASGSISLDTAVRNSILAGVSYVVAAGNNSADACLYSPARVSQALTVGATTSKDKRASFSNFGSCLNLFAPGSSILSASHQGDTVTAIASGTSMASPHVAGAAALYLQGDPSATPAAVFNYISSAATAGKVSSPGSGSPNLLLFTPH